RTTFFGLVLASLSHHCLAQAMPSTTQDYPNKPITLVVGFPAGGGADALARLFSFKLSEAWKVPVAVENRTGASGMIAASHVVRSLPDGYTVYVGGNTMLQLPHTQPGLSFDMMTAFKPIVQVARTGGIFAAHPSSSVNSVSELIEL